ncbi:MAG: nitrate reductase [Kiritimatiellia bacterium]|nr:nitrate reductase [Kiritimatiellia bacterium]
MKRRSFIQLTMAGAGAGVASSWAGMPTYSRAVYTSGGPEPGHVKPEKWVYSTCGFCGTGCGLEIGIRDGKAVATRGTPDYPVNDGRLCAKAVYQWKMIESGDRAKHPMIRTDGQLRPVSWDAALDRVAGDFRRIIEQQGPDAIACYNTGQLAMEDYYVLGKLMRAGIGTAHLDGNTRLCMASAVAGHARSFGTDGPVGAYEDIEAAQVILISGSNMAECHPILFGRIVRAREKNGTKIICVDPRLTQVSRMADLHLPIRPGSDLALLNAMAHVVIRDGMTHDAYIAAHTQGFEKLREHLQRYSPDAVAAQCGVSADRIEAAARMYGQAERSVSMWVMGINQSVNGTQANNAFHNLNLIQGKIGKPGCASFSITGQPSAMAAREVGGSSSYPGFRGIANEKDREEVARLWGVDAARLPSKSPAISEIIDSILDGKIRALWVICTNPLMSLPDQNRVRKALRKLDLLVVQDAYQTVDTAQEAQVFLPAALWAEKSGLLVNSERRLNLLKPALAPPGEARPDFDIILDVARRLGYGKLFPFRTPEEAFEEIKIMTQGRPNDYSGATYARIEENRGLQWPIPDERSPGTPRLYADGLFNTADRRAVLWSMDPEPLPEIPDTEYPVMLNSGRVQEHFHTGTKTRAVEELNALVPTAYAEIHPRDAERLGVAYGDRVRVESRRGQLECRVVVTEMVAPGSCFIPMHFREGPVNALTVWAFDPYSREPNYKQQAVRIRKAQVPA